MEVKNERHKLAVLDTVTQLRYVPFNIYLKLCVVICVIMSRTQDMVGCLKRY